MDRMKGGGGRDVGKRLREIGESTTERTSVQRGAWREEETYEVRSRKVTSFPEVMETSSPSCDFSMLVIGAVKVME